MRQPPRLLAQDAETGYISTRPSQARQDAPLPELRSRVAKILNVAHLGKEPVLAAWGGRVRSGTLPVLARLRPCDMPV